MLQYPELPLVDVGGQKKVLLPPEVCEILEDQPFRGKLTDDHTANMIRFACQPPNINGKAIVEKGLSLLGFPDPMPTFNVRIGLDMAVVPGRILPRPAIKYSQGTAEIDAKASWNLRDVKFAEGAILDRMAVLVIKDGKSGEFAGMNDPELHTVINGFRNMCAKSGMRLGGEPIYLDAPLSPKSHTDPMRKKVIDDIRNHVQKKLKSRPTIIMVMLADGDKAVYEGLKHLCDVHLGVHTVCVQSSKIRKGQPQYYANVALKFNMKLGGVNHDLNDGFSSKWLAAKPTMIVGMDVTHPGFGSAKGTRM